jgi:hypothetical protein
METGTAGVKKIEFTNGGAVAFICLSGGKYGYRYNVAVNMNRLVGMSTPRIKSRLAVSEDDVISEGIKMIRRFCQGYENNYRKGVKASARKILAWCNTIRPENSLF